MVDGISIVCFLLEKLGSYLAAVTWNLHRELLECSILIKSLFRMSYSTYATLCSIFSVHIFVVIYNNCGCRELLMQCLVQLLHL